MKIKHLKIGSLVRVNTNSQNPNHLLYGLIDEIKPNPYGNFVGVKLDFDRTHENFTEVRWFDPNYLDLINP